MTSIDTSAFRSMAETGAQRVEQLRTQMSDLDTTYIESAKFLAAAPGMEDKLQAVRDAMVEMLQMDAELGAHADALRQLATAYEPPFTSNAAQPTTNFDAAVAQIRQQTLAAAGFDPNASEHMLKFDREVRAVQNPEGEEEDPDADIIMGANPSEVAVNSKCPISLKPVLELSEPVEDPHGYVYEKAIIMEFIRRSGHNGTVAAPIAGVNYSLTAAQLKPARKVIRKQKQMKSRPVKHEVAADAVEIE